MAMTAANAVCIRHMWRARRLQWSKRRTRLVVVHYAMLNLQVPSIAILGVHDARCTCSSIRFRVICTPLSFTPLVYDSCDQVPNTHFSSLLVQMVNAAAWLAPNIRVLQTRCAWCGARPHT